MPAAGGSSDACEPLVANVPLWCFTPVAEAVRTALCDCGADVVPAGVVGTELLHDALVMRDMERQN